MQNLISKILILLMFAILSGCASITESKNQSMSVTTGEVTGAMCTLSNSKGSYYVPTFSNKGCIIILPWKIYLHIHQHRVNS